MAPAARYSQAHRDRLSGRLLVLLRDFAERGEYPSVRLLCDRLAEGEGSRPHDNLIRELRDGLEDLGLWVRPAYWPQGAVVGLDGSTDASLEEIEANRRAIFAEKVGRGEEPAAGFRPARIPRSPDYRLRENRR